MYPLKNYFTLAHTVSERTQRNVGDMQRIVNGVVLLLRRIVAQGPGEDEDWWKGRPRAEG